MDVFLTSFPKKLLVATSVVIVLAMCVTSSEGRSMEHKIRHERRYDLAQPTKDNRPRIPEPYVLKNRIKSEKQTMAVTKEMSSRVKQRIASAEPARNAMRKILKKLKNTRTYFKSAEKQIVSVTKEFRAKKLPRWLPSVNFVDIHAHNYKSPRKTGVTMVEQKIVFLMPKLYKSLAQFHEILTRLLKVEVNYLDNAFHDYYISRQRLIKKTVGLLFGTMCEVSENLESLNITVPEVPVNKYLDTIRLKIDAPECYKNDFMAVKAYGQLLTYWYSELRCPAGKEVNNNVKLCKDYENNLRRRKKNREDRRNSTLTPAMFI